MPRRATGLPYVAALDGVRALAVTGVLLYHGQVSAAPGGFLGVDVFFVLSGFLITSLLLAERTATGAIDLGRFLMRRARRLLPAAFLVIGVCLLVVAIFLPGDLPRTRGDAVASFLYVNNWHQVLAHQSYFQTFARPSLLQHLWSLAVEEQFYLVWPIVLGFALSRLGRRATVVLTILLAVASALDMGLRFHAGHDPSHVYFGTDSHASGLLIGALLAFAWPLGGFRARPHAGARLVLDLAAVAGIAGVVYAMATVHDFDTWPYHGGIALVSLAAAVMIAAVSHPACRVGRVLGIAPARWIGQRSYGIYLWHWPVMAMTRPGLDLRWSPWLLVPLQIAVAVVLAAASYRFVEMPVRNGAARAWLDRRSPRRRLGLALGTAVAMAVAVAFVFARGGGGAAQAAHPTALRSVAARRSVGIAKTRRPLAVGASVMLAAQSELARHMTVDAAVGRQVDDILARLEAYRAAGHLPTRVVVQMGENGPVFASDIRRLRHDLAGVRRVVLVNVRVTREWRSEVDHILAKTVSDWPQAHLADWYAASADPTLLYADGTHPTPAGAKVYARLVEHALR